MGVTVDRERVVNETHIVIRCDVCGTEADAVEEWIPPTGWVLLRRITADPLQQSPSSDHYDFCSWSCCRTFVKLQVDPGA